MARRRRRPEPKVRRWPIWAAAAGVAGAVVLIAGATTSTDPARPRARGALSAQPASVELLRASLQRLDRCLTPGDQERLYDELRAELEQLTPAVIWVLNQPEHGLFAATAALAAELPLPVAAPPLREAAWSRTSPSRTAALVALDRLEPLPAEDVSLLLTSQQTGLELAGALLLAARDTVPAELCAPLLALLSHPERKVRDAAFTAVPEQLPAALADAVIGQLDDERGGPLALQVLDRFERTDTVAETLARRLAIVEPEQQLRLVGTIERYAAAAPVREVLWDITDTDTSIELRMAALACLERGGEVTELPASAAFWPAPLRYQGARLLLQAGEMRGVDWLLELAEGFDDAEERVRAAAGQSRVLLGQLAKLPPHAELAKFALWRAGLQEVPKAGGR